MPVTAYLRENTKFREDREEGNSVERLTDRRENKVKILGYTNVTRVDLVVPIRQRKFRTP